MTIQADPERRITELLELAADEGKGLALRPEAIVLPVLRYATARGAAVVRAVAGILVVLLLALASLAPMTAQAQTARPPRRPSPVPVCRLVHGVRVCAPVTGGSGITPPVFAQQGGGSR